MKTEFTSVKRAAKELLKTETQMLQLIVDKGINVLIKVEPDERVWVVNQSCFDKRLDHSVLKKNFAYKNKEHSVSCLSNDVQFLEFDISSLSDFIEGATVFIDQFYVSWKKSEEGYEAFVPPSITAGMFNLSNGSRLGYKLKDEPGSDWNLFRHSYAIFSKQDGGNEFAPPDFGSRLKVDLNIDRLVIKRTDFTMISQEINDALERDVQINEKRMQASKILDRDIISEEGKSILKKLEDIRLENLEAFTEAESKIGQFFRVKPPSHMLDILAAAIKHWKPLEESQCPDWRVIKKDFLDAKFGGGVFNENLAESAAKLITHMYPSLASLDEELQEKQLGEAIKKGGTDEFGFERTAFNGFCKLWNANVKDDGLIPERKRRDFKSKLREYLNSELAQDLGAASMRSNIYKKQ